MTRAALTAIVVLAALAGPHARCSNRPTVPRAILLVTLDTTRADRLSPYGFADATLPHLDRLAREGVVFDQASSVAPLTLPAHASLFTGLWPPAHAVRDNASPPLAEDAVTLAELLRGAGFRTAAFVGADVLNSDRGLDQGFDHYGDVGERPGRAVTGQRPADEVVSDAARWIEAAGDARIFVWVHLYDPHRPYQPPEPFATRHGSDPYVGEIAFADSQIGRVLDAVERRHRVDETLVIVTSDHGESLGEHGERDHGIFVYESVLRIPLIIRAPGVIPRRVPSVVRLIDVMPTVLAVLDLPPPLLDGASLLQSMREGRGPEREAYAESEYPRRLGWSPLRSLRVERFKLIEAPRPELYDLEADPFEARNLYHERRSIADALGRRLATHGDSARQLVERATHGANSLDTTKVGERLGALGYLSGGVHAPAGRRALPDPKDCLGPSSFPSGWHLHGYEEEPAELDAAAAANPMATRPGPVDGPCSAARRPGAGR